MRKERLDQLHDHPGGIWSLFYVDWRRSDVKYDSHAPQLRLPGAVGAIVAVTTIEIATHIAVAIQSPAEAQSARDEREKVIALKATRPAFYVFMAGVWLALGVVVAGGGVWILVQATLFAIWIAELTRFGTEIYYYRRGLV
jgi:hypothetical protein